jgi:DNA-directed RNA polymerase subunit RPC12/RpoP
MMEKTYTCYQCGQKLTLSDYGRGDVCPGCRFDTRVCKNCEHFDASLNNQCRETQAERVVEKTRSNFCDYFQPTSRTESGLESKRDALLRAAEALFKKK